MVLKTLYVNGMIFTSNSDIPYAEAMSVSLGAIDYIGTNAGLMESLGLSGFSDPGLSEYEVIDLKGRTVVPGFVDADIRPLLSDPVISNAMRSSNGFSEGIMELGRNLSAKGIIGFGTEGNYGDKDAFELLVNLAAAGLDQNLALYYPVEFAMKNPDIASDKQRLIRSRKVHLAGLTLPPQEEVTEEMYDFALEYCTSNSLQLSVEITDESSSIDLLESLMAHQSWLEDMNIPNIRVHRGGYGFDPFVKIKEDLTLQVEKSAEGEEMYGLDEHFIGYTRHASDYSGFVNIGELKVGNSASFLILDRDLSSIPVAELDQVHPEVTIIDGHIAYKAPQSDFQLRDQKISLKLSE